MGVDFALASAASLRGEGANSRHVQATAG